MATFLHYLLFLLLLRPSTPTHSFRPKGLVLPVLYINPRSTASAFSQGEASAEYFIKVNSINITDTVLPLNKSLLNIDSCGHGGTKISTVNPYTLLEASIYKLLSKEFSRQAAAMNISRVAAVAPFDTCFSSMNVHGTRLGPNVPWIYLYLEGNGAWTITGSNSMVDVRDEVLCLAFVNGGLSPKTSIVIGGKLSMKLVCQT